MIALTMVGCDNGLSHLFGAYTYDPEGDCLGPSGIIDVLEGPETKPCEVVRCFVTPSGNVLVTDQACDAPPDFVEHTEDPEGPCVKALEAYASEGHGRCPRAAEDAGAGGGS